MSLKDVLSKAFLVFFGVFAAGFQAGDVHIDHILSLAGEVLSHGGFNLFERQLEVGRCGTEDYHVGGTGGTQVLGNLVGINNHLVGQLVQCGVQFVEIRIVGDVIAD